MPELPEIEIVKRSLFKKINGAKIVNVKINNKNLRYKITHALPKKLINADIKVAQMNAIAKDSCVRPVISNTFSFVKTLMTRVDKYNRVKTVNLKNPPKEL